MRTRGAILSSGARYCERVIDCDIHPQIGDPEELLAYVDPAQREWFRAQALAGASRLLLGPPRLLFRQDIEQNGRPPASDVETVARSSSTRAAPTSAS